MKRAFAAGLGASGRGGGCCPSREGGEANDGANGGVPGGEHRG